MEIPLRISFRNMERTDDVVQSIEEKVAKLEQFFDRIVGCHVVVEAPHKHHRQGNIYRVDIYITVPHKELVVNREPGLNHAHEDVHVALRDAFDKARRQLEDYVRELRGDVKQHSLPLNGQVVRLFDDYGFLETPDGLEVYFHANSLLRGEFEQLQPGDRLRFVLEEGEKGPQATSVHLLQSSRRG